MNKTLCAPRNLRMRERCDGSHRLSSPYHYWPVSEEAKQIRLLTLLPGRFSDDVRVTLETVALPQDGSVVPHFEALSYAWGSLNNKIDIHIGKDGFDVLAVTQNLAIALPYLRLEQEPRVLWIDAICVNQKDLAERSSQVQRMADIYSRASRVVVWVGPETNDSDLAMDAFELICKHVAFNYATREWHPLSEEETWCSRGDTLPFKESQLVAILNFLDRSWFERLWIWQEVRLASASTILLCGARALLWISVCNAIPYLHGKRVRNFALVDTYRKRVTATKELCDKGSNFNLLEFLNMTKVSVCSDPKDRIFALLSMLPPWEDAMKIIPDYTKSASEVYYDIAVRYIESTGILRFLNFAETGSRIQDLPTWFPDWSVPRITNPMPLGRAASLSDISGSFQVMHRDSIIQVMGIQIATIRWIEAFQDNARGASNTEKIACELKRVALKAKLTLPNIQEEQLVAAICRTAVCGDFAERWYPRLKDRQSRESGDRVLQDLLQYDSTTGRRPPSATGAGKDRFMDLVRLYCSNRSLFVSQTGGLGLGPNGMRAGDIAVVLLGLASTMILRPIKSGKYTLVGEAYCHGYMNGEALLGPLPSHYKPIERLDEESGRYYSSFLHSETGEMTPEDPRLGELPVGWSRKSHPKEEFWQIFFNQETGVSTNQDSRLSLEALLARGVPLKTFEII